MAKKPSPDNAERASDAPVDVDNVAALRAMSREDRLRALMKNLDAACGPMPARRRSDAQGGVAGKPDKKR